MAHLRYEELEHSVTFKWTAIEKQVIKSVSQIHRNIVFLKVRLLNQHWVLVTIVYNPKTNGQLKEIDKRIPVNEFLNADLDKLTTGIVATYEQETRGK